MKQCPRCGSRCFCVTAHVTQDWVVDENGAFLRSNNDCVEVTHFPDDEDVWSCENCGYSASGKEFNVEGKMPMNTRINYQYRDGANYKVPNEAVVAGEISDKDKQYIFERCLEGGEYYIPRKVGLPERTMVNEGYEPDDDLDHPYFELQRIEPTEDLLTIEMTVNTVSSERRWDRPHTGYEIRRISGAG